MRIISTPLPAVVDPALGLGRRPSIVMAFDTLVDEKSLVVGITVGVDDGPDLTQVRVRPAGQAVIDRCRAHHALNYPDGQVVLAAVGVGNPRQRVRQVLGKAAPGAMVLLLCVNDKVYDTAFDALGADLQALRRQPQ